MVWPFSRDEWGFAKSRVSHRLSRYLTRLWIEKTRRVLIKCPYDDTECLAPRRDCNETADWLPVHSKKPPTSHSETLLGESCHGRSSSLPVRESSLCPGGNPILRRNSRQSRLLRLLYGARNGSRSTKTLPFFPTRTHSILGRENSVVQIGLSTAGHR